MADEALTPKGRAAQEFGRMYVAALVENAKLPAEPGYFKLRQDDLANIAAAAFEVGTQWREHVTASPCASKTQALTDEQIDAIWHDTPAQGDPSGKLFYRYFARALLAASTVEGQRAAALRQARTAISAALADEEGLGSWTRIDDDIRPDLQAALTAIDAALSPTAPNKD